jgi:hypothetical protein
VGNAGRLFDPRDHAGNRGKVPAGRTIANDASREIVEVKLIPIAVLIGLLTLKYNCSTMSRERLFTGS